MYATDKNDKLVGKSDKITFKTNNQLVEATVSREVDNPYRGRIEFPIVRGDYLVVTCEATTAEADVVIEWGEQI